MRRFEYIKLSLIKEGITVIGTSSDGDSRCLKAQKILCGLGFDNSKTNSNIPNGFQNFFCAKLNQEKLVPIQDPTHIVNKLKNRALDTAISLVIGESLIPFKSDLERLIDNVPKLNHNLSKSDLNSNDKMSANKAIKMCDEKVENALLKMSSSDTLAIRIFLRVMRYTYEPLASENMKFTVRLYKMWYAVFVLRAWRKNNKATEFITLNAYICQEINAHGFTNLSIKLRNEGMDELLLPSLFQSQTCESFFRKLRSFSSCEETVVNFDMKDVSNRIKKIQILEECNLTLQDNGKFCFEDYILCIFPINSYDFSYKF